MVYSGRLAASRFLTFLDVCGDASMVRQIVGSRWASFWLLCFSGPSSNLRTVAGGMHFGHRSGILRSLAKLRSKRLATRAFLVGSSCSLMVIFEV